MFTEILCNLKAIGNRKSRKGKLRMERLRVGDTIGIVSPSHLADKEKYDQIEKAIKEEGFQVRFADLFYANGWTYAATLEERAEAIHSLVRDDEVKLIFFGGGEGGDDVIPYLDYDLIEKHPKLWLSISDGTSILNAVHNKTGLNVFYGAAPSDFLYLTEYNRANFFGHMVEGDIKQHKKAKEWISIVPGVADGILSGGYLENYVYLANGGWVVPKEGEEYILCLEEHEMFFQVDHVSDEIARLENSPIMKQTKGILFGIYSEEPNELFLQRLKVLGEKHNIPIAYCEDFGHSNNHAILEIGAKVTLDTIKCELYYR